MSDEAIKRRLAYSVVVTTVAYTSFIVLLKSFNVNLLECKAHNLNVYSLLYRCSLVMSFFLCDLK